MEILNLPDPNVDRLVRLLRRDPTGGELRGLSAYEDELGAERVSEELEQLVLAGVPADRQPMGVVHERLRAACQERRARRRRDAKVFGAAGRPMEHDGDQYEAKVRRDSAPKEVIHG